MANVSEYDDIKYFISCYLDMKHWYSLLETPVTPVLPAYICCYYFQVMIQSMYSVTMVFLYSAFRYSWADMCWCSGSTDALTWLQVVWKALVIDTILIICFLLHYICCLHCAGNYSSVFVVAEKLLSLSAVAIWKCDCLSFILSAM